MTVRATFETNAAFVLRPDDIRRVWTLLEKKVGSVEAVAFCADDFEREFSTVDELVSYENFPSHRIVGLQIGVWSEEGEKASIGFTPRYSSSIRFAATGVENEVAILRQHVASLAEAIKPWYSFLTRIPRSIAMYALLCIPAVFLPLILALPPREHRAPVSLQKAVFIVLLAVLGVAALAIILAGLNALRLKLFPTSTFAIGAGAERYQTAENIRWVMIVGFFVSLAAAIVFALIWK